MVCTDHKEVDMEFEDAFAIVIHLAEGSVLEEHGAIAMGLVEERDKQLEALDRVTRAFKRWG